MCYPLLHAATPFACAGPDRYVGGMFGSPSYDISQERADDISFEEQLEGMQAVIEAGKVRCLGVCTLSDKHSPHHPPTPPTHLPFARFLSGSPSHSHSPQTHSPTTSRIPQVRYIGVSNETSYGVSSCIHAAERAGLPRIQTIQNVYHLMARVNYEVCSLTGPGFVWRGWVWGGGYGGVGWRSWGGAAAGRGPDVGPDVSKRVPSGMHQLRGAWWVPFGYGFGCKVCSLGVDRALVQVLPLHPSLCALLFADCPPLSLTASSLCRRTWQRRATGTTCHCSPTRPWQVRLCMCAACVQLSS